MQNNNTARKAQIGNGTQRNGHAAGNENGMLAPQPITVPPAEEDPFAEEPTIQSTASTVATNSDSSIFEEDALPPMPDPAVKSERSIISNIPSDHQQMVFAYIQYPLVLLETLNKIDPDELVKTFIPPVCRAAIEIGVQLQKDGEVFGESDFPDRFRAAAEKVLAFNEACGEFEMLEAIKLLVAPDGLIDAAATQRMDEHSAWEAAKRILVQLVTHKIHFANRGMKPSDAMLKDQIRETMDRLEEVGELGSKPEPENPAALVVVADQQQPFPVHLLPPPMEALVTEVAASAMVAPAMLALSALSVAGSAIGTARKLAAKVGYAQFPIVWTITIAESGTRKSPVFEAVIAPIIELQRQADVSFHDKKRKYDRQCRDRERQQWQAHEASAESACDAEANPNTHTPVMDPFDGCSHHKPLEEPNYEHVFTSDLTVESVTKMLSTSPKGILVAKDELSDLIGNLNAYKKGANDAAKFLEWYNGTGSKTDRKTSGSTFIERAAVWVTGLIQPKTFWANFPDAYRDNGFLSRFLIAYVPLEFQGWSETEVQASTTEAWTDVITHLRALTDATVVDDADEFAERSEPVVLHLTPEARQLFADFCDENGHRVIEEKDAALRSAYAKMNGHVLKLALIDHLVRQVPVCGAANQHQEQAEAPANQADQQAVPTDHAAGQVQADAADQTPVPPPTGEPEDAVSVDSIQRALGLVDWFTHEACRIYRMKTEMVSTCNEDRRELLDFIIRKDRAVTPRDVAGNFRRFHKNSKAAHEELDGLVVEGLGKWQPRSGGKNRGRRTEFFVLRKDVTA